ncbi:glutamate--tRNA ligase, partial [Thermodesulfobacteriota bacterium]
LRTLPVEEIEPYVKEELEKAGIWNPKFENEHHDWFLATVDLIRSRFNFTTDFVTLGRAYFSDDYDTDPKALKKNIIKHEGLKKWFSILADRFQALETFSEETTEDVIRQLAEEFEIKAGILINGIRTTVTGQAVGPGIFDVLIAIGQDRVVERTRKAVGLFDS